MIQQSHYRVFFQKKLNHYLKEVSALHVHCSIIYNSQCMKTTKMSVNGLMDKKMRLFVCVHVCVYTHTMEYYSVFTKKEILSFLTTWMNLEGIMLSEINQT